MESEFVVISLEKYNELYKNNKILNDIYDVVLDNLYINCIKEPTLSIEGIEKLIEIITHSNQYIERKLNVLKEEQTKDERYREKI